MSAPPKHHISVVEYLEGELSSEIRHEYFDGKVSAMAGGTSRHNAATLFFAGRIDAQLSGGPCQTFSSDFKVKVNFQESDLFYYPDVFVACDPDDNHRLYRKKPKFWLEVMSDDENKDLVEKDLVARRIETMEEYVLVKAKPENLEVIIFRRSEGWEPAMVITQGEAHFDSIGVTVSVMRCEKLAAIEMTD